MALKRGMFGGARSYFNTQASSHVFTGTTTTDLTIRVTFDTADFPMLFVKVYSATDDYAGYVTQRTGRYTWRVFLGGAGSVSYTIACTCISEQVPVWSIGP